MQGDTHVCVCVCVHVWVGGWVCLSNTCAPHTQAFLGHSVCVCVCECVVWGCVRPAATYAHKVFVSLILGLF